MGNFRQVKAKSLETRKTYQTLKKRKATPVRRWLYELVCCVISGRITYDGGLALQRLQVLA